VTSNRQRNNNLSQLLKVCIKVYCKMALDFTNQVSIKEICFTCNFLFGIRNIIRKRFGRTCSTDCSCKCIWNRKLSKCYWRHKSQHMDHLQLHRFLPREMRIFSSNASPNRFFLILFWILFRCILFLYSQSISLSRRRHTTNMHIRLKVH
jgi:hypothetical protein